MKIATIKKSNKKLINKFEYNSVVTNASRQGDMKNYVDSLDSLFVIWRLNQKILISI